MVHRMISKAINAGDWTGKHRRLRFFPEDQDEISGALQVEGHECRFDLVEDLDHGLQGCRIVAVYVNHHDVRADIPLFKVVQWDGGDWTATDHSLTRDAKTCYEAAAKYCWKLLT